MGSAQVCVTTTVATKARLGIKSRDRVSDDNRFLVTVLVAFDHVSLTKVIKLDATELLLTLLGVISGTSRIPGTIEKRNGRKMEGRMEWMEGGMELRQFRCRMQLAQ